MDGWVRRPHVQLSKQLPALDKRGQQSSVLGASVLSLQAPAGWSWTSCSFREQSDPGWPGWRCNHPPPRFQELWNKLGAADQQLGAFLQADSGGGLSSFLEHSLRSWL